MLATLAIFAPVVKTHAEKKAVKIEVVNSIDASEDFTINTVSLLVSADLDAGVDFVKIVPEAKREISKPLQGFTAPVFRPPAFARPA